MVNENNLDFIKNRIAEIRSAILYPMSNEMIKIPSSIITVLKVDESGQIWFFLNRPLQKMSEHEKTFPARLQFYRKGKPFYMQVSGYAGISDNQETINEFTGLEKETENIAMQNLMLVKLKIAKAEYYEQKSTSNKYNSLRNIFQNIYSSLFKSAGHSRPFELNTEAA
jgi:general stress protein 26